MERAYEVLYIVRPDIDKAEYEQVTTRYEQAVRENGGTVQEVDEWGICPFAYDIGRYDKGYYVLMRFLCDMTKLPTLEERFKLDERVIRHQFVRREEPVPSQTPA